MRWLGIAEASCGQVSANDSEGTWLSVPLRSALGQLRRLYKTQLVDERESLAVSDITYLFTDLKDSTPLYESVGDVNAYFLVRQHFDILNKIIRERSGTIVKTIGDAVMAGFERPQDAVLASIEMIEELSRFNQPASRPLGLKVG